GRKNPPRAPLGAEGRLRMVLADADGAAPVVLALPDDQPPRHLRHSAALPVSAQLFRRQPFIAWSATGNASGQSRHMARPKIIPQGWAPRFSRRCSSKVCAIATSATNSHI